MSDYRSRIYPQYATVKKSAAWTLLDLRRSFSAYRNYFGQALPKNKDARILDIACGHGGLVFWLQQLGYQNAQGIDLSREQVELARKLGIKNVSQAELREFLRAHPGEFDSIFGLNIIEHFKKEEILPLLQVCHQALVSTGKLVLQTNNEETIWGSVNRYSDFTHEVGFTASSLREVLLASGFSQIWFKETGPVVHGLFSLVRWLLWQFIRLSLNFYLLVEVGRPAQVLTQGIVCGATKNENHA